MIRFSNVGRFFINNYYNQSLSFDCQNYFTSFHIIGPQIKMRYPSTMDLRSYKCMQIRSIKTADRFVKGSKYSIFSFNLPAFNQLCFWEFSQNQILTLKTLDTNLTIENHPQHLTFEIFSIKLNKKLCQFNMSQEKYTSLVTFLRQSIPQVYGLEEMYSFEMKKQIEKVIEGDVEEIEDHEENDFFIL